MMLYIKVNVMFVKIDIRIRKFKGLNDRIKFQKVRRINIRRKALNVFRFRDTFN